MLYEYVQYTTVHQTPYINARTLNHKDSNHKVSEYHHSHAELALGEALKSAARISKPEAKFETR